MSCFRGTNKDVPMRREQRTGFMSECMARIRVDFKACYGKIMALSFYQKTNAALVDNIFIAGNYPI